MSCGYSGRHFGAGYDDGICADGYLWDLDSCDEPGGPLHSGGEIPCPACNTDLFLRHHLEDATDGSFGCAMGVWWCGATIWRAAVARALAANREAAAKVIHEIGDVVVDDFRHQPGQPLFDPNDMIFITIRPTDSCPRPVVSDPGHIEADDWREGAP